MAHHDPKASSLYQRIGGAQNIDAMIYEFYRRVFADPLLSPFFEEADAQRLRRMQREFFAAALEGPIEYSGMSLREAHAGRGIETQHLARFVEHLMQVLADRGIEEADRYEIVSHINTYADEITGGTTVDG